MKDSRARIERITRVNAHTLHVDLATEDETVKHMKPGQSMLVRVGDMHGERQLWTPYLREQWWMIGVVARDVVRVELPFTADLQTGQVVQLLAPIGQPYRFRRNLGHVLLIAYNAMPSPLVTMVPSLLKNNVNITLVLMGTARSYDTQTLPPEVEVIRADDKLEWDAMVRTISETDQTFIVVAQDDELMRFHEVLEVVQKRRPNIAENVLWGVFRPPLPCGVGACDACALRLKDGVKLVCVDGPAFDLTQVK